MAAALRMRDFFLIQFQRFVISKLVGLPFCVQCVPACVFVRRRNNLVADIDDVLLARTNEKIGRTFFFGGKMYFGVWHLNWRPDHFHLLKKMCSAPKRDEQTVQISVLSHIHFGIRSFISRLLLFSGAHRNLFLYWFGTEKRFKFYNNFEFVFSFVCSDCIRRVHVLFRFRWIVFFFFFCAAIS